MYVMLSYIRRERIVRGPRIGRKSSFVTSIFLMMMSGRWMDYSQVHLFNRGGLCRRYYAVHSAQWVVFCFFPLFNDVTKREKCNKGAQKMSLFTTLVELWRYDSHNLCSKKRLIFRAPLWPHSKYIRPVSSYATLGSGAPIRTALRHAIGLAYTARRFKCTN